MESFCSESVRLAENDAPSQRMGDREANKPGATTSQFTKLCADVKLTASDHEELLEAVEIAKKLALVMFWMKINHRITVDHSYCDLPDDVIGNVE